MSLAILKCLAIGVIGLAVAIGKGTFLGIAAGIALIACILDKERFANFRNKTFNLTMVLFLIYVGTIAVSSMIQDNQQGLRMVMRDFEKIAPFLIMYIFIGKVPWKKAVQFGAIGFVLGVIIGEGSVFVEYFKQTGILSNRYGGIYGHPNAAGSFWELTIPFLIFLVYEYRKQISYAFPLGIILLGTFICLYLSSSRGAMMAVVAEIMTVMFIYFYRKYQLHNWLKYAVITVLSIGIMLVLFAKCGARSYDSERILLLTAAWQMFLDYPLLGVGFSQWGDVYRAAYLSPLAKEPMLPHPHNLYLFILSESGLIGFLAYFTMICGQLKIALHNSLQIFIKEGSLVNIADMFLVLCVGMLIHNLVDVHAIHRYYLLVYFFFWGLCCLKFEDKKV